jgi:histidinol-phosphatase (PHP family)
VDYLVNDILDFSSNTNIDYLIGSVHFIDKWGFDNPEFIGKYQDKDIDVIWRDYFSAIDEMVESGLFDIVGHLDLIKVFKFYPKADITTIIKPTIEKIAKSNMSVEINSAGYRKPVGEQYPSSDILKMCYEAGIDITFGSDAHELNQVGLNYDKALDLAKDIGYTFCVYYEKREKIRVEL